MRKVLALFAAVMLLFTLAACGGDDSSSSNAGSGDDTSQTTSDSGTTDNHTFFVDYATGLGHTDATAECAWEAIVSEFPDLESKIDLQTGTPPDGYVERVPQIFADCEASTASDGSGGGGTDTGS